MREASFYCENCGKLVSIEDSICPSCKNSFQAVRCPVCSFTGKSHLFLNGCPSCGYLAREEKAGKSRRRVALSTSEERGRRSLPRWLFPVITLFLIGMIVLFALMLLR
jgi:predicted RNA-binding Zn-ribbon protein involved in translation (DUF1610 family)